MGNKSGGFRKIKKTGEFRKIKKTGGELNSNDIEKINELITNQLVTHGLIPTSAKKSSAIEPLIDISSTSSAMSKKASISDMVFAKSIISLSSGNGPSDVFFHMVKITEENLSEWSEFEKNIKKITPNMLNYIGDQLITPPDAISKLPAYKVESKSRHIYMNAGLDYFEIRKSDTSSDLFVVYASKTLNKTKLPPNWQDVEIMVTVASKEGVPFATPMGIVKLAHTYPKKAFGNMIGPKIETPSVIENKSLNRDLYAELDKINFNYPSHRHISLYLFTFIGTFINQFYVSEITALFTSPTNTISSIVTNTLKHDYILPYGYERERMLRFAPNYIVKLNLYYLPDEFLILSRDNLKELCPWYCNIFQTERTQIFPGDSDYNTEDESRNFDYTTPKNTGDCYKGANDIEPFLYVPIHSFNQLVDRGVYQFEPIE